MSTDGDGGVCNPPPLPPPGKPAWGRAGEASETLRPGMCFESKARDLWRVVRKAEKAGGQLFSWDHFSSHIHLFGHSL